MGLNLNNALHKLDTAYPDWIREAVPFPQDKLLNGRHLLPGRAILWMVDTAITRQLAHRTYIKRSIRPPIATDKSSDARKNHLHMPKYQRVQTRRRLHDALQDRHVPLRQLEDLADRLQHVCGELFLLRGGQRGTGERLGQELGAPSS